MDFNRRTDVQALNIGLLNGINGTPSSSNSSSDSSENDDNKSKTISSVSHSSSISTSGYSDLAKSISSKSDNTDTDSESSSDQASKNKSKQNLLPGSKIFGNTSMSDGILSSYLNQNLNSQAFKANSLNDVANSMKISRHRSLDIDFVNNSQPTKKHRTGYTLRPLKLEEETEITLCLLLLRKAADPSDTSNDGAKQLHYTGGDNLALLLCTFAEDSEKHSFKKISERFNVGTEQQRDRSSLRKRLEKLIIEKPTDWESTRIYAAKTFVRMASKMAHIVCQNAALEDAVRVVSTIVCDVLIDSGIPLS